MLLHDTDLSTMFCTPEFDISGYFCDHQIQLRKVRKEMEEMKEEKLEVSLIVLVGVVGCLLNVTCCDNTQNSLFIFISLSQSSTTTQLAAKRQRAKLKKKYKEEVLKMFKVVHKLENDMEDVEVFLQRLLDMHDDNDADAIEEQKMEQKTIEEKTMEILMETKKQYEEKNDDKYGEAKTTMDMNDIASEGKDTFGEKDKEDEDEEKEQSSNVFVAATEDARDCMLKTKEFLDLLPETGDSEIDMETGEVTGVLALIPQAKRWLSLANKAIKKADKLIFQEHTIRTVKVPSLLQVLSKDGEVTIMLKKVHEKIEMEGGLTGGGLDFFHGITLFVPHDRGFSEETIFSEDCWGTHILRGPYNIRDLYDLSNNGPGNILCDDMDNSLSVGMNGSGEFVVFISKVGHPDRICRVERSDVNVENGTVVHFVDKVLFPPAF